VDARLREEARRFALRFACEDCAHFDAHREACVHGYPAAPRLAEIDEEDELLFCKEFELGGPG
jgi:hypothetical protein